MPRSFHSEKYKIFIALLREARERLDISQEELAAALAKDQTYVSKGENGIRRIDVVELDTWLRTLNIDRERFMRLLSKRWDAYQARTRVPRRIAKKV